MTNELPDGDMALRDIVAAAVRTIVPLAKISAELMAEDILRSIQSAGYPLEQASDSVYVAMTNPLGMPPDGYYRDALTSIHKSVEGAQRALNRWAEEHGQYAGFVSFDAVQQRIEE